jgi:hypothetical protein
MMTPFMTSKYRVDSQSLGEERTTKNKIILGNNDDEQMIDIVFRILVHWSTNILLSNEHTRRVVRVKQSMCCCPLLCPSLLQ